jgi:hypothetical protein
LTHIVDAVRLARRPPQASIGGLPLVSLDHAEPHNYAQPTPAEKQHSHADSTGPNYIAKEDRCERKNEGKWHCTFFEHTPDWAVATFTALLIFLTIGLVKVTNRLP